MMASSVIGNVLVVGVGHMTLLVLKDSSNNTT